MHHKNANKKQKNVPTSGSNYARRMGIHSQYNVKSHATFKMIIKRA